ncbi:hypothetical protein [Bacillus rubiinfantis]|uniref:hypothetical protein n=1 Tax=Bacillus rubiinfantis TaxID=1499680 RepID=UPI0005AAEF23|nr:hypothetical protein [Bacillus rubiinfantis]
MAIEVGSRFLISESIQGYYNSADSMTVLTNNGVTVQFLLADGKGHGAMPIDHFQYLIKKTNLTKVPHKRVLISQENEEQIG